MESVPNFVEKYNIHLLNLIFVAFTLIMVVLGGLISLVEPWLPKPVRQSFLYGKNAFKGPSNAVVNKMEVPKSWFKHFYVFAFGWSVGALFLVLKGFLLHTAAPECVLAFLDYMGGGRANRHVQVDTTSALIAIVLITIQCTRRFYESNFVQIFSKEGKINVIHYLVGYYHYFGVVLAIIISAEGFVRGTVPSAFNLDNIGLTQYLCILLFLYCWVMQYNSNMILVNLRRDGRTGQVATERHLLPKGGWFEYVSSAHMFFEILMYISLAGILPKCVSWWFVVVWVVGNQTVVALITHKWYQENFKSYPKQRYALIPLIL